MKARLVRIGNSQGVRLPKPLIEQAGLSEDVEVHSVDLKPTRGKKIRKARSCVVVSPDELNAHVRTFIVAPLTTESRAYPFRVACRFHGKSGHVILDQIRTVDRDRLIRRLGRLSPRALGHSMRLLQEMFAR